MLRSLLSRIKKIATFTLVVLGSILLTSFSIDATDTLRGSQTALSIFSKKITEANCPSGMAMISGPDYSFCVDKYEASASDNCVFSEPKSVLDTTINIADSKCKAVSEEGKQPWTFLARPQAEQLCAKDNKRIPSANEWYLASMGTPDSLENCNLAGKLSTSGSFEKCISGAGAFDMVGNVWEFIGAETEGGSYGSRVLPDSGYVTKVDADGVALSTDLEPQTIYNNDYFWLNKDGNYTILRGGFYGSGTDGGVYATNAQVDANFAGAAMGFRCAMSLN